MWSLINCKAECIAQLGKRSPIDISIERRTASAAALGKVYRKWLQSLSENVSRPTREKLGNCLTSGGSSMTSKKDCLGIPCLFGFLFKATERHPRENSKLETKRSVSESTNSNKA